MIDTLMLKLYLVSSAAVCGVACVFALVALVKSFRLGSKMQQRYEMQDDILKQQRESLTEFESNLLQHSYTQNHLEEKIDDIMQKLDRLEVRDSQFASYHHAAKLVELGANSDDVVKTCGLSRAEAELVAMVNNHRTQKTMEAKEHQAPISHYQEKS